MMDFRSTKPATKPPTLPLSAQMVVFAEMAAPELAGAAHMVGTSWQAEALRLEGVEDRIVVLEEALAAACADAGHDERATAIYIEQAERKIAAIFGE